MIFVTVGTHEQPFNRLIEEVDKLKKEKIIDEDVFIQTGYSTYEPQYCKWSKLIAYEEMQQKINDARIIITHGGPSSFLASVQIGKIPIVVPRQKDFGEHVNNHQLDFTRQVSERMGFIIPVYEIKDLKEKIINYDEIVKQMNINEVSNNKKFCELFEKEVNKMFGE